VLTSLCDKSLVAADQSDGASRFRLVETVRQYAREKLVEGGGGEAVRERHGDYFLALAEKTLPKLLGAEQAEWLQHLEEEHDNLRASLDWSLVKAESGVGLRLCGVLQRFWFAGGHLSEGREWCARVLGAAGPGGPTPERAKALNTAGVLAYQQGDYPAARALDEEGLAIWRQLGDRRGIAASLNNLGLVICDQGDFPAARALYEESLAIKRELGDRSGIANSLNNLGNVAYDQADLTLARALYEESLGIARELGDKEGVARLLGNLGNVALHQRDFASAQKLLEESLAIKRKLGYPQRIASSLISLGNLASDQGDFASARALFQEGLAIGRELGDRLGIATSLAGLAAVVAALGSSLRAARIWGATERLRADFGSPLTPKDRPDYDRRVAAARAALGDDAAFDHARREGHALTLEQAIELALGETVEQR
jgi:non-specific serine/threonine protein kinase